MFSPLSMRKHDTDQRSPSKAKSDMMDDLTYHRDSLVTEHCE